MQISQLIFLDEKYLTISFFKAFKFQNELDSYFQTDMVDKEMIEAFRIDHPQYSVEAFLAHY